MASTAEKHRLHLFRLQLLIIDGGLFVLRHILDQKLLVKSISFDVCLAQEKTTITQLKGQKGITQVQYDLLYPTGGQLPSTADLDITLTICLLRSLKTCGLNSKFKWNVQPQANDTCIEADLYRLKEYRNEVAHISTTTGIDSTKFNSNWTHIEQILLRLNTSTLNPLQNLQTIIDDIKARSLDPEAEERIDKAIKDWQIFEKGLEVDMQAVKSDISELYKRTDMMKDLQESVTKIESRMTTNTATEPAHDDFIDDPEIEAAKKALEKGWVKLLECMIPEPILDCGADCNLFTFLECRDIREEKNTTERNRSILETIRRKGENGYTKFKDCLLKTDQSMLAELLTKIERDENTEDVLKQIHDKMIKAQRSELTETIESTAKKSQLQQLQDEYQQKKKQLKEDIAEFNRCRHSTIPLSPLFDENDTHLLDFYLMPGMKVVNMTSGDKTTIQSLSEVYKSGSKFSNEIYVTADAGFGKTAFAKYMTVLWRQAHFPDAECTKHLIEESVNTMREFEFLFLVLLRDSSDVCSIDELVFNQVVQNLSRSTVYNRQFLQEVSHRERCLVVLDGLDEWTHPQKCDKIPQSVPHRNFRENCTILTTTRPWKLSITKLNSTQIDKKIELSNLDRESALTLTTRALKKLKAKINVEEETTERLELEMRKEAEDLLTRYQDFDQVYVPLLLMYIICLWRDEFPVGQSKCGLYTSIIELLLSRTISKYEGSSKTRLPPCIGEVPQCLRERKHCKAYFTFLTALGKLAFQTLFSETRETCLVFDSSKAEECLKEDFLKLGRLTGIITQDKQSKLLLQINKTSFSHKTVQEFFAALYISTCSHQEGVLKKVLLSCNFVKDILEMSEVFIFISGINADSISLVSEKLMKVINEDAILSTYRSVTFPAHYDKYIAPVKEIQDLFISCNKEIPKHYDFKVCLQDLIFDKACQQENYYANLQRLAVQNKNNIKSIRIEIQGIRTLPEIITECELSDPALKCQKVYYRGECKEAELIPLLSRSAKCVTIISSKWRGNDFLDKYGSWSPELSKIFQKNNQLQAMHIQYFNFSHDLLNKFLNYIVNRKSMKDIRLYDLVCADHNDLCSGFNFDLSQHTELRVLGLNSIPLSHLNVNVSLLEECYVGAFSTPGIVTSYLSNISAASKLETITFSRLESSGDIEMMLQTLSLLVSVKYVRLSRMNLGERLLPHEVINIEYVWLWKVTMSSSSLRNLISWLETLPQQVTVDMKGCNITPNLEFEEIKGNILTSEKFVVIYDGETDDGMYSFEFKSTK